MIGCDVSHYQGHIDWPQVALSTNPKIDFVYLKSTQGNTYIDPMLKFNAYEAKQAGFKIGYYHFATLNSHYVTQDAEQEALFFIDTIKKMPAYDLPLVLDIEVNKAGITRIEVDGWIKQFFATLIGQGKTDYVLYSSAGFLNENLPTGHSHSNTRLWLAHYTEKPAPKLPTGWTDFWMWQKSQTGKVAGIKGYVDMNRSKGDLF